MLTVHIAKPSEQAIYCSVKKPPKITIYEAFVIINYIEYKLTMWVFFFLPKRSKVLHDISLLFLENIKVTKWECECIDSIFQKTEMEIIKSYISFA